MLPAKLDAPFNERRPLVQRKGSVEMKTYSLPSFKQPKEKKATIVRSKSHPRGHYSKKKQFIMQLNDFYYLMLRSSWGRLLVTLMFGYIVVALFFTLMFILPNCNLHDTFNDFKVESNFFHIFRAGLSLSLVASADQTGLVPDPKSTFANVVWTLQSFIAVLAQASITGVVFARFSRPSANIRFTNQCVITDFKGTKSLVFRLCNMRHPEGEIVSAEVSVTLGIMDIDAEGHPTHRSFIPLTLRAGSLPRMLSPWTLSHAIVPGSPLHGLTPDEFNARSCKLTMLMQGLDVEFMQTVHGCKIYDTHNILFDHEFVDMVSHKHEPNGDHVVELDWQQFDVTRANHVSACGGRGSNTVCDGDQGRATRTL